MELVKKTKEYTILKKKSGRHGVQGPKKQWINGDAKTKILVDAGLIKVSVKSAAPVETATEETAE